MLIQILPLELFSSNVSLNHVLNSIEILVCNNQIKQYILVHNNQTIDAQVQSD